jgi:hypothetical protein
LLVVVVLEFLADCWCWQALLLEDGCDELWWIAMLLEYEVLKYLKLSFMYPMSDCSLLVTSSDCTLLLPTPSWNIQLLLNMV